MQTMTVQELKERLAAMPDDATVTVETDGDPATATVFVSQAVSRPEYNECVLMLQTSPVPE